MKNQYQLEQGERWRAVTIREQEWCRDLNANDLELMEELDSLIWKNVFQIKNNFLKACDNIIDNAINEVKKLVAGDIVS